MKKSLFLIAPIAFVSLLGCGGNAGKELTLAEAQKKAQTFEERLKADHKAKSATITGTVNQIKWDGTFNVRLPSGQHYSVGTPFQVEVNNQALTDIYLPYSDIDELLDKRINVDFMSINQSAKRQKYKNLSILYAPIYLTRFAVNDHFLKVIDGVVINEEYDQPEIPFDWDKSIIAKPWGKSMEVKYYEIGDKLKITMHSDNLVDFFEELATRFVETVPPFFKKTDAPLKTDITLITDDVGYVEEVSYKMDCDHLTIDYVDPTDDMYIKVDGSLKVDTNLKLSREYREQVKKIKFLINEYAYDDETGKSYIKNTIDTTDNLSALKKYFTLEWYDYNDNTIAGLGRYGDPIFDKWYWLDIDRNIAYQNEAYDVVLIPAHEDITRDNPEFDPKYTVFGYDTRSRKDLELTCLTKNGQIVSYYKELSSKAEGFINDTNYENYEYELEDGEIITLEVPVLHIHIDANALGKVDDEFVVVLSVIDVNELVK